MTEKWTGWDTSFRKPTANSVRSIDGWRIPLLGTDPSKGLTELIVALSTKIMQVISADSENIESSNILLTSDTQ